ncbi:M56 family metallopeptidase [Pseudoteredinibacter isoporae]|uniref:M56 family metallopeptidase n=1 Tax=Pseudoteredinibacter isoporae TaxID=570281 RepID=UPI00310B7F4D
MTSYLVLSGLYSVLSLLLLRSDKVYLGFQRVLCASAIVMWCLPWPLFSRWVSASSVQLVPSQPLETLPVFLAAQPIQVHSPTVDEYLGSLLALLVGSGVLLYLFQLYKYRRHYRALLVHAEHDASLEKQYGGVFLRVNNLASAMLLGFWRPAILLPARVDNEQAFEFMVQHELAHRENKDHWRVAVLSFLQCLFFWNPLVRQLISKQRNLIEAQCDAQVAAANPVAYREALSRMALQVNGFDMSCSMAMGNLIWRLKRMENGMVQKKLTMLNVVFLSLFITMLMVTVVSLLGSSQAFALQSERAGAVIELKAEMRWKSKGMMDSSLSNSSVWLHYNEEFTFSFDNGFQLNLMLSKKEEDTILISTTLLKLGDGLQVLTEPQLLVLMGEEAVIETGDESEGWHYAAVFKVNEEPQPKGI